MCGLDYAGRFLTFFFIFWVIYEGIMFNPCKWCTACERRRPGNCSRVYNHGCFLFRRDQGVEARERVPHTGTLGRTSPRPLDAVLRSIRGYAGLAEQGLLTGGLQLL